MKSRRPKQVESSSEIVLCSTESAKQTSLCISTSFDRVLSSYCQRWKCVVFIWASTTMKAKNLWIWICILDWIPFALMCTLSSWMIQQNWLIAGSFIEHAVHVVALFFPAFRSLSSVYDANIWVWCTLSDSIYSHFYFAYAAAFNIHSRHISYSFHRLPNNTINSINSYRLQLVAAGGRCHTTTSHEPDELHMLTKH